MRPQQRKALVAKLPRRQVRLAHHGVLLVPRHIQRIDIEDGGNAGTHGWQVRYRGQTKLFSDGKNGGRHSPRRALREAISHLTSIYAGATSRLMKREHADKRNPVGIPGVRIVTRKKASRQIAETFVEISPLVHGRAAIRLYVGTENTVNKTRVAAAIKQARVIRENLVREALRSRV